MKSFTQHLNNENNIDKNVNNYETVEYDAASKYNATKRTNNNNTKYSK